MQTDALFRQTFDNLFRDKCDLDNFLIKNGLDGATVDITVQDDRIEVRSPGPLPGHITIDNMRDEHYSRNPRIMRILKTVGLVEEYGDGIDRMYHLR